MEMRKIVGGKSHLLSMRKSMTQQKSYIKRNFYHYKISVKKEEAKNENKNAACEKLIIGNDIQIISQIARYK